MNCTTQWVGEVELQAFAVFLFLRKGYSSEIQPYGLVIIIIMRYYYYYALLLLL